jgi:hypothetical protein
MVIGNVKPFLVQILSVTSVVKSFLGCGYAAL